MHLLHFVRYLKCILDSNAIILSVTGPYAGESERDIFKRKRREIETTGYTFWHHQSRTAKPRDVQTFCKIHESQETPIYFVLITASSGGSGGDTKKSNQARYFKSAVDGSYNEIPEGIYVETGRLPYALVIKELKITQGLIDLWDYSNWKEGPIKTSLGASTLCAVKKPSQGMKSRIRKVVACAEIVYPYSVWLK